MTVKKAFALNCFNLHIGTAAGIIVLCSLVAQGCSTTRDEARSGAHLSSARSGADSSSSQSCGNHLKDQVSPYLLEHANDPVNWYPWGDEAFARAKRENKPVFLSSGFAACHWCHVMQRESFQDPATAKILNDNFISIKVDREERPYVDEVYTRAAQAVGGRAGWPLTVFLTPDKKPFFAGTYFPKSEMYGLPPFTRVLSGVIDSWHKHRGNVDSLANDLCLAIAAFDGGKAGPQPDRALLDSAGAKLLEKVDQEWGGINGDRKFALPGALTFALQMIVSDSSNEKSSVAADQTKKYLAYITSTLNHMSAGGMHDQLRGGFFRYSTDRFWHVPHFEKMLCDNALIAQCYLHAGLLTGDSQWRATGLETLDFCLRDFASGDGGFYGSLDADSGGQEGAVYTFTQKEIEAVLGVEDGQLFCTAYSVNPKGNTRDGRSILYLADSQEKLAQARGLTRLQWQAKIDRLKTKLAQSELVQKRVRPTLDKKAIAGWNALMISALVDGYKVSADQKYLDAARKCAQFLIKNLCQGKTMHRIWAGGKAEVSGCLDDYAYSIRAFLDLASVDSDPLWLSQASGLNETVVGHFIGHRVGFFYTANNKDQALVRTGCAQDSGQPSPAALQVANLMRLYQIYGDDHLQSVAQRTIRLYGDAVKTQPTSFGFLLAGMDDVLHQGERLVILEGEDKALAKQLKQQIWRYYAPHVVVLAATPQQFAAITNTVTKSNTPATGAAYFCMGTTCDQPITDPAQLRVRLEDLRARGEL